MDKPKPIALKTPKPDDKNRSVVRPAMIDYLKRLHEYLDKGTKTLAGGLVELTKELKKIIRDSRVEFLSASLRAALGQFETYAVGAVRETVNEHEIALLKECLGVVAGEAAPTPQKDGLMAAIEHYAAAVGSQLKHFMGIRSALKKILAETGT